MKKVILTAALGLLICGPALANEGSHRGHHNRCEVGDDATHCSYRHGAWKKRMHHDGGYFIQAGQDLNSNRWNDGSPRATLPPHNARGSERPATTPDSGWWVR
jgi:hypothetical protein